MDFFFFFDYFWYLFSYLFGFPRLINSGDEKEYPFKSNVVNDK